MSALSTSETREPNGCTASTARLTTSITVSQSGPSTSVNMLVVRCGRPDSRTTRTAAATASCTEPSGLPVPDGATEKAMSMIGSFAVGSTGCADADDGADADREQHDQQDVARGQQQHRDELGAQQGVVCQR